MATACGKKTGATSKCSEKLVLPVVNGVNLGRKRRPAQSDPGGFRRKLLPLVGSAPAAHSRRLCPRFYPLNVCDDAEWRAVVGIIIISIRVDVGECRAACAANGYCCFLVLVF